MAGDAVAGLSATELRDALLVLGPLDRDWVARVNQAEAEYWKRCVLRGCAQVVCARRLAHTPWRCMCGPRTRVCVVGLPAATNVWWLATIRAHSTRHNAINVNTITLNTHTRSSAGQRVGYADQLLGFDCGGQQWVLEVAFPIGTYSSVTSSWRSPNTCVRLLQAGWQYAVTITHNITHNVTHNVTHTITHTITQTVTSSICASCWRWLSRLPSPPPHPSSSAGRQQAAAQ
jgi:hypothetical protein